ncbi:MAG: glycosyltransferase family 39 protein [Firmicutes bacterium]|nr:glycosyltransferase family 39 protein [Bacillota bacterium]
MNCLKKPIVFLLIFILFFSLYFFLKINLYSPESFDYAASIEKGDISSYRFWRMEHPLWEITGRGAYLLGALLGFKGNTLELMQLLNAVCGSLAVAFFFLIIFRLTKSLKTSLFCAFLLGFSYYFWFWNAEVKFYSLAALFVMLTIYFFTAESFLAPAGTLLTGFFFALAMLYHSANMVLFLPLTIAFFLNASPLKKKFSSYMLFLAAILVFFVIPHLIILIKLSGVHVADFWRNKEAFSWFGASLRLEGIDARDIIFRRLPLFINLIAGSLFMGMGPPTPHVQINFQLISFIIFLLLTIILFIKFKSKIVQEHKSLSLFCLFWASLQITALWIVDPYNYYIYIALVPLVMLLSLGLKQLFISTGKTLFTIPMCLAILALFFLNLFFGILPYRVHP